MGSDLSVRAVFVQDHVSIHAPAWGATNADWVIALRGKVSIHAPAWGATMVIINIHKGNYVSIHAPAWGATDFSK